MVDEGCSFCVAVQHHGSQFGLPGAILAPGSASQCLTKGSTCCVAFRHRPRPSLSLTSACAPHPAPATGGDSVGQHFCISIYNKTIVLTIAFRLCLTFPTYAHAVHLSRCHSRTGSETNAHAQTYIYICMYVCQRVPVHHMHGRCWTEAARGIPHRTGPRCGCSMQSTEHGSKNAARRAQCTERDAHIIDVREQRDYIAQRTEHTSH